MIWLKMENKEAGEIAQKVRNSPAYKRWRKEIILERGTICENCKIKADYYFEVHHKKSLISMIKENQWTLEQALQSPLIWDKTNGQVLCDFCHFKAHGKNCWAEVIINFHKKQHTLNISEPVTL